MTTSGTPLLFQETFGDVSPGPAGWISETMNFSRSSVPSAPGSGRPDPGSSDHFKIFERFSLYTRFL